MMLPSLALSVPVDDQITKIDSEIDTKKEQATSTKDNLDTLKPDLEATIEEYQIAYAKLQEIDESIAKKQRELNSATEQQIFYQKILNKLSVFAYRDGDVHFVEVILGTRSFKDLIVRVDYLNKLTQRQAQILFASKRLRQVIKENRDQLEVEKAQQKDLVASVQTKQEQISSLLTQQQTLLDSLGTDIEKLESDKSKKVEEKKLAAALAKTTTVSANVQMIFPIPSPHAHTYINDWGFARATTKGGHQGTDVFAAKGTPLIAVADGVIGSSFGYLRIGGYRMHVIADDGADFYYAHLNNDSPGTDDGKGGASTAYASGIAPGVRVQKGQLIGYVGDSGDAEATPPHLHFGITLKGWINPYPYLKASDWK